MYTFIFNMVYNFIGSIIDLTCIIYPFVSIFNIQVLFHIINNIIISIFKKELFKYLYIKILISYLTFVDFYQYLPMPLYECSDLYNRRKKYRINTCVRGHFQLMTLQMKTL